MKKTATLEDVLFLSCKAKSSPKNFLRACNGLGPEQVLNARDSQGRSVLEIAVSEKNYDVANLIANIPELSPLLDISGTSGENPRDTLVDIFKDSRLSSGEALAHAIEDGLADRCEALFRQCDPAVNLPGKNLAPLPYACLRGTLSVVRTILFLSDKKSLSKKDEHGLSVLDYAMFNQRGQGLQMTRELLEAGAVPQKKTLLTAKNENFPEIAKLLESAISPKPQVADPASLDKKEVIMSDKKSSHNENIRKMSHLIQGHFHQLKGEDPLKVLSKGIASAQYLGMEIIAREERAKGVQEGIRRAEAPVGQGLKSLFGQDYEEPVMEMK